MKRQNLERASRVNTPILTKEFRRECGAGRVLLGEGHDVTRERISGTRAWRHKALIGP